MSIGRTSIAPVNPDHGSKRDRLWSIFEVVFAVAAPCTFVPLWYFAANSGPWHVPMILPAFWAFAAIEVEIYGIWRLARHKRSTGGSALFAGWLAAGSIGAAALSAWMARGLWGDWKSADVIMVMPFSAIPAATAVAFALAARTAWRSKRRDQRVFAWAQAIAAAIAILSAVFFWPITSHVAIERAIARIHRGGPTAVEEAAQILTHVPWADRDMLHEGSRQRANDGQDARSLDELYRRVTELEVESALSANHD